MKKPRNSKGKGKTQGQPQQDDTQPEVGGTDANPAAEGAGAQGDQPAANDSNLPVPADGQADQPESTSNVPALTGEGPGTALATAPGDSLVIVPRHIQREEDRAAKRRALFNSVCSKAANITGRMAVTSVLKIAGASLAIGAGASALGVAAAGIALAGIGSAAYTYGSESYKEYRARKEAGEEVSFINVLRQSNETRLRRTVTSLACGVAFGALGAYLMQSDLVQWAVEKAGPVVQGWVSYAAGLFGLGTPSADDVANAVAPDAVAPTAAPDVAAAAPAPEAPVAEVAAAPHVAPTAAADGVDAAPAGTTANVEVTVETTGNADVNVDVNVSVDGAAVAEAATVSSADVAADPLAAGLAQSHIASADGVSSQTLKDAAHSILRMDNIDAADRVAMARALAQEAAERGNAQAVSFLTDLPRVEASLGLEPAVTPEPVVVADAPITVDPIVTPSADTLVTDLPDVTLDAGTDTAATVITDGQTITPVAAPGVVTVSELPPLAPRFATEAAVCSVTMQGDVPADINCSVSKEVMDPTDYISFVDAANPTVRVTTTLDGGSVAVATGDMLQEVTLSDGASRLQVAVRTVLGLRR